MSRLGRIVGLLVLVATAVIVPLGVGRACAHTGVSPDSVAIHTRFAVESESAMVVASGPAAVGTATASCASEELDGSAVVSARSITVPESAGVVEGFDGSLSLGTLATDGFEVDMECCGNEIDVQIWIDTDGNGSFFEFDPQGNRTGFAGDSSGFLSTTTSIESGWSHLYTKVVVDVSSAYTPRAGTASGATLGVLRASLGDDVKVAVWAGVAPSAGETAYTRILAFGRIGAVHTPCIAPLSVTAAPSPNEYGGGYARGFAVQIIVRGARYLDRTGCGGDSWSYKPFPVGTDEALVRITRPSGATFSASSPLEIDYSIQGYVVAKVLIPASEVSEVGVYAIDAAATSDGFAVGSGSGTVKIVDVPTAIGQMTFSPSGSIRPGSRVTASVSLTRTGNAPAQLVPVHWVLKNVGGAVVAETISTSGMDGKAVAAFGAVSFGTGALGNFLQTATPGPYTVSAYPEFSPELVATGSFTVLPV